MAITSDVYAIFIIISPSKLRDYIFLRVISKLKSLIEKEKNTANFCDFVDTSSKLHIFLRFYMSYCHAKDNDIAYDFIC